MLKIILAVATGKIRKGANTMDVKGGNGAYDTKTPVYPF